MKEILETYRDIIIAGIIAIIINSTFNLININNTVIDYIMTNIIPVAIPTFVILLNKPKFYLKLMYYKVRHSDVRFKIDIKLESLNLYDEKKYEEFIDKIKNNLMNNRSTIKNMKSDIGEYIAHTIVSIDAINYDIYYNFEDETMIIEVESNVSYKKLFNITSKLESSLNKTLSSSKNIGYDKTTSVLNIEFLDDDTINISNPFFKKVYNELTLDDAKMSYSNNNVNIVLNSTSIILKSSDFKNISYTFNKEFKLLGDLNK